MSLVSITKVQSSCVSTLPVASTDIFPILSLPKDILCLLLGTEQFLDNNTRMVCRFVCRSFKALTDVSYDEYDRDTFVKNVAKIGKRKLLEWAHSKSASLKGVSSAAASGGQVDMLKWLFLNQNHDFRFDQNVAGEAAAIAGHLPVLQWIDIMWPVNQYPSIFTTICVAAASNGHLNILQWANQKDPHCDIRAKFAAFYGQLHILKWAYENGKLPDIDDNEICVYAAKGGQLKTLQWARSVGFAWDELVCLYAAGKGDLEMLQWARENFAPWDETTCGAAAANGHLHVLQWARENFAPWNATTCASAFEWGHFSVFEWAREHGAPVVEQSLVYIRPIPKPQKKPTPHILSKIKPQ